MRNLFLTSRCIKQYKGFVADRIKLVKEETNPNPNPNPDPNPNPNLNPNSNPNPNPNPNPNLRSSRGQSAIND